MNNKEIVNASVGIIENQYGEILICKRIKKDKQNDLYGYLEFQGGKFDENEDSISCLVREIEEEVGLILDKNDNDNINFIKVILFETDKVITHIHFFKVNYKSFLNQIPIAKEGQPMQWIKKSDLNFNDFPSPNKELILLLNENKL